MDYTQFGTKAERLYIAYGSNLNKGQMRYRCPDAKAKYKGLLSDYELFYAGSMSGNYATIRQKKGCKVPVAVWEISERDERNLDAYEGFPIFYFKRHIKFWADGIQHTAMVYIMREDAIEGVPSERYVETVRQGYRDFGFDEKYLDNSLQDWAS